MSSISAKELLKVSSRRGKKKPSELGYKAKAEKTKRLVR